MQPQNFQYCFEDAMFNSTRLDLGKTEGYIIPKIPEENTLEGYIPSKEKTLIQYGPPRAVGAKNVLISSLCVAGISY